MAMPLSSFWKMSLISWEDEAAALGAGVHLDLGDEELLLLDLSLRVEADLTQRRLIRSRQHCTVQLGTQRLEVHRLQTSRLVEAAQGVDEHLDPGEGLSGELGRLLSRLLAVRLHETLVDRVVDRRAVGLGDEDPVAEASADRQDVGGVQPVAADDEALVAELPQLADQVASVGGQARDDDELRPRADDVGHL